MDHHVSVAFAADANTVEFTAGDRVLADAVRRRGADVRPMVWGAPCDAGELVVIRSTWDYAERPDAFGGWLDELDAAGTTVVNPTALLRWNMHKGYLAELAARGVSVVPTEIVRSGSDVRLGEVMVAHGWDHVVVKPAVGASARETFRVDRAGLVAAEARCPSAGRCRRCARPTVSCLDRIGRRGLGSGDRW